MVFRIAHHIVECGHHDLFQALIDRAGGPKVALTVLHPFEIAHGDAARIGEDVGDYKDATFKQYVIGRDCGGGVGTFTEDFGRKL